MNEPVFTVIRYNQAVIRLQVLRGLKDASNKLMSRLLRKYPAINIRDGNQNFRLFKVNEDIRPLEKHESG